MKNTDILWRSPLLFFEDNSFEVPTKSTLAEFEAQLRKDIESDIAVNNKTKAAIAALGNDVQWEVVLILENHIKSCKCELSQYASCR